MAQHAIDDTEVYARYLKEHPDEISALFKELLINVTSFFRDPEAFATLQQDVLPGLFSGKAESHVFRVWVAGCASGEEAYSIAIVFREFMDEIQQRFKVQIYATDIDDDAIAVARGGIYPSGIARDLSPERLRRFFSKEATGFRVKRDLREMVVFAIHNVIKDPPFTRLDLLSCRNLMIYLEPELQNRLFEIFHYALGAGGVLLLSPSESIGRHSELFAPLHRKWKFYRVAGSVVGRHVSISSGLLRVAATRDRGPGEEIITATSQTSFAELARRALLQHRFRARRDRPILESAARPGHAERHRHGARGPAGGVAHGHPAFQRSGTTDADPGGGGQDQRRLPRRDFQHPRTARTHRRRRLAAAEFPGVARPSQKAAEQTQGRVRCR
jgi:two-component system CheB/CheR fusion protein